MEAASRQPRQTQHMLNRRGVIEAHRGAVDHLRKIGYEQKDIEATFKEEVSQKKSEVYEIYKS